MPRTRTEYIDALTGLAERAGGWVVWVIGGSALGGGGLMAWAAYATEWLNEFGPIAWVLAGFVGIFLVLFIWLVVVVVQLLATRRNYFRAISSPTETINPLDDTFIRKRIKMQEFRPPYQKILENKIFKNCEILGPAAVYFSGGYFDGQCQFVHCELLSQKEGEKSYNAIGFENAVFQNCQLFDLIIIATHEVAKELHEKTRIEWRNKDDFVAEQ